MANSVLYGLLNQKDLGAELTPQNIVVDLDKELLIATTLDTIQQHNEELNALRGLFADDTTDYTLFYAGYLGNELQEGDETARPDPVKGLSRYSVGFPIREAKTAWGATYTTREQMTILDYSQRTDQMLIGDVNWHRKWIFGTLLFDGTDGSGGAGTQPYVFTDPKFGSINVNGLANGDATLYDKTGANTASTDTHYTSQNGAISDTSGQNPFPTIETALTEHPENGTTLVSFIAPNLEASVRTLAGFVPASSTFLAIPGSNTATFDGQLPVPLPPKSKLIGVYDNMYIVRWASVPASHIITIAVDGPKPLLHRQYPQASLQGYGPVGFSRGIFADHFPYFQETWYRAGGFGSFNRVGAQVHQVTASTTYVMSTTYAPLFGRGTP